MLYQSPDRPASLWRTDMAATSPETALGTPAFAFALPSTDGRMVRLADVAGPNGTVVAFICNHCPYVVSAARRIVADARALAGEGVGFVAICSNDAVTHPADSFDRMKAFAAAHEFPFPYLHDESQAIARAYGAVCTPDFFGFDRDMRLAYRGRLDGGGTSQPAAGVPRELLEGMRSVVRTGRVPARQMPAVGCSIKWKAA
jgi:peroxiredoxin